MSANSGNKNAGNTKQGPPKPNLQRAERLAAELRANLKRRKSASKFRDEIQQAPDRDDSKGGD